MSSITMYDTIYNAQFPAGAQAYAAYVEGALGDQPNYPWIVRAFPHAEHLSIALDPAHDAMCLDIENGAASPADAAAWYERQKARGIARPCLYANASTMQADVLPVITAAKFPRAGVRLWSAHYGAGQHICGPATCGLVSVAMDGTQWTDNALGRVLDESLLLGTFFAAVPLPPGPVWFYGPPRGVQALGGHTSVRLSWEPPAGAPVPPDHYAVFIYHGTLCSKATIVASYPRTVAASPWEGGGLERGRTYTAHIVASGPANEHVAPGVYGSVTFKTG